MLGCSGVKRRLAVLFGGENSWYLERLVEATEMRILMLGSWMTFDGSALPGSGGGLVFDLGTVRLASLEDGPAGGSKRT